MIRFFKYRISDGEIVLTVMGEPFSIADQPEEPGYDFVYGIPAEVGEKFDPKTLTVKSGQENG
jgi:hypothetical protein